MAHPRFDAAARNTDEYFGLAYSSYLILPRVLLQSMPDGWQQQLFQLLADLNDAFPNAMPGGGRYIVRPADECQYSDLSEADMRQLGVTPGESGDTFYGSDGVEHDSEDSLLVPEVGDDPLADYRHRSMTPAVPDGGWRHQQNPTGQVAGMAHTLTEGVRHLTDAIRQIGEHVDRRADELTQQRIQVTVAEHRRQLADLEQVVRDTEDRARSMHVELTQVRVLYDRAVAARAAGTPDQAGAEPGHEPRSD